MPTLIARLKIPKARCDAAGGPDTLNPRQLEERRVCSRIVELIRKRGKEWARNWDTITTVMRNAESLLQYRLSHFSHVCNFQQLQPHPHGEKRTPNSSGHVPRAQRLADLARSNRTSPTSPPPPTHPTPPTPPPPHNPLPPPHHQTPSPNVAALPKKIMTPHFPPFDVVIHVCVRICQKVTASILFSPSGTSQ